MSYSARRENCREERELSNTFIVGAGRSGTTWLQLMLGAHPLVATGQETQIFENYLKPMHERWCEEVEYPESDEVRKHGISSWIDERKFFELTRQFCDGVLDNILSTKPGAKIILEKSPNSSLNVELIFKCYPKAKFVHLVRDGRDVCASMLAAKTGWGKEWAPTHAADAAAFWKRSVEGARNLEAFNASYIEVRYEDLLEAGEKELQRVFNFLDVDLSHDLAGEIYNKFTFDKLKRGGYEGDVFQNPGQSKASGTKGRPEPKQFFRKGVSGGWVDSLSSNDLREIYWMCGDLLLKLGYPDVVLVDHEPLSIRYRRAVRLARDFSTKIAKNVLGAR